MAVTIKINKGTIQEKVGALKGVLPNHLLADLHESLKSYYDNGGIGTLAINAGKAGYVIGVGKNKFMGNHHTSPSLQMICNSIGIPVVETQTTHPVIAQPMEPDPLPPQDGDEAPSPFADAWQTLGAKFKGGAKGVGGSPSYFELDLTQAPTEQYIVATSSPHGVLNNQVPDCALAKATALNQPVMATSKGSVYRVFMLGDVKGAARWKGDTLSIRLEGPGLPKVSGALVAQGFNKSDGYLSIHLGDIKSTTDMAATLGWAVYLIRACGAIITQALSGEQLGSGA